MNCKYLAEKEAKRFVQNGLHVVILNPSVVLGPGDIYLSSSGSVLWFCKKKFPGYMDGTFNVVDVEGRGRGTFARGREGKARRALHTRERKRRRPGLLRSPAEGDGRSRSADEDSLPVRLHDRVSAGEAFRVLVSQLLVARPGLDKALEVQTGTPTAPRPSASWDSRRLPWRRR